MFKKLLLVFLLIASPAFAQQVGYYTRTDCGSLAPVESQTICLQTTTVSGRTAGHLYVYRGAVWVDVDSAGGGGSGDIEGVTAGTNLTGGGTSGTVTLNVANPVVANLTGNVTGNVTGNAGTATALAANGANCSAGNAPLGVDASGAVESCFDVATQTELNTHEALTGTSAHGAVATNTASQIVTRDASGNFAAGTITATLSGNATTATTASGVAANSVALGTDTTGNYVSSATANQGLLLTGTEGASLGLIDCAANEILKRNAGDTAWACATDSTGGSPSFDTIAAGTNTTAAMVVGTGGSLAVSGSGTIAATTAAALAANPADCAANNFATTIAANGDLTCAQPSISAGVSGLGTGVATFLGTPSSANLASALTDETGTGAAVFATSPTLVTPILGTPTSGTLTNATGLPLTTGVTGTLPVANGGTGLTSGTSGGVLAYTASGTLASSGALTANLPVIGGGAGVAPTVGTRSGNTTAFVTTTGTQTSGDCVKIDANGNHVANGSACGSGGGTLDGTRVYNSTDITTASAAVTYLTFDSERYDNGGLHSTSSNTGRITFATAGVYTSTCNVRFATGSATDRIVYIILNHTTVIGSMEVDAGSDETRLIATALYHFAAADYIECAVFQATAGNLNVLATAATSPEFSSQLITTP